MSRTYQPQRRKRKKAHGFLSRSQSRAGRRLILRRKRRGRARLTA